MHFFQPCTVFCDGQKELAIAYITFFSMGPWFMGPRWGSELRGQMSRIRGQGSGVGGEVVRGLESWVRGEMARGQGQGSVFSGVRGQRPGIRGRSQGSGLGGQHILQWAPEIMLGGVWKVNVQAHSKTISFRLVVAQPEER